MIVNCKNILKLPACRAIRMLAGKGGQGRIIKWVYYLEDPGYIEYLGGGELVITTGVLLKNDIEAYIELTERLYKAGAAGLVVNLSPYISAIPAEVLQMGDDLDFPIYEMPAELHIIDVSQNIGRAIINAADDVNRQERFLLDLLYNQYSFTEKRMSRIKELGYDSAREHVVYVLQMEEEEEALLTIVQNIRNEISQPEEPVFCVAHKNQIVVLAASSQDESTILAQRVYDAASYGGHEIRVGYGNTFQVLNDFAVAYEQAQKALSAISPNDTNKIRSYSEMGLQRLLYEVGDEDALKDTVQKVLGGVLRQDNADEILETLTAYLDENGRLNRTAERLFIHINTLRYRIRKIEDIMQVDLQNYNDLFQIQLALYIKRYLESSL